MDDKTKVAVISKLIADFWEFNEPEDMRNGAVAMVTAISTIVDFNECQAEISPNGMEMIRIRYAAAKGVEKSTLGDVLRLLEGEV